MKFQDVYYEQPASQVAKANKSLSQDKGERGSLRSLGLDPRSWLGEAKDEGEEEVAGVKTRHVSDARRRGGHEEPERSCEVGRCSGQRDRPGGPEASQRG